MSDPGSSSGIGAALRGKVRDINPAEQHLHVCGVRAHQLLKDINNDEVDAEQADVDDGDAD